MAENSAIEWTDATVNFWWGCTKVGPGCDHCYAEAWARRTGLAWGLGTERRKIKGAVKLLYKLHNGHAWWAADHHIGKIHATSRRRVFIQSMSDLFDTEVPIDWFSEAWSHIAACDRLAIQIVTKRISVVEKRLAAIGMTTWPKHAGLMISIVNQDEADRDIPRLIALKQKLGIPWIGLSMEPLLGPVDLRSIRMPDDPLSNCTNIRLDALTGFHRGVAASADTLTRRSLPPVRDPIDWVIVGGESGPGARPMHPDWARSLRDQCAAAGVPFLFKQHGEWVNMRDGGIVSDRPVTDRRGNVRDWMNRYVVFADDAGAARVRGHSFTDHGTDLVYRVGKKQAGRLLDGMLHDGMPAHA